ncbi:MAG: hypothetical protein WCP06_13165, partial [Verrucomicrobiota bacterium]
MKLTALILALFAASLFLSACSTTPEDKEFFDRGWVFPNDREQMRGCRTGKLQGVKFPDTQA